MTNKTGLIVAGALAAVLLLAGGVTTLVLASAGDPTTVAGVAEAAVEAAEDLDVEAGVDLLCEAPPAEDRRDLERLIEAAQEEADTEDPDVDYEISNIVGDSAGTFDVRATSDEDGLSGEELSATVQVEERDGRSCISSYDID
ncbi:hypothetical protein ASE01_17655 [Nocardioides sp. Root190]|uniref:Rv0361 family membrane protein n=1 Tax=Nocardioides sp. Root190 TaxID=1736488 RepID=UPI0006F61AC4|nr:hypothetical protein [Nocardioides sp. Root190]KRB73842.1 hypothetical protein ASE01_17655 [Nocardioides sp. Root190]